MKIPRITWIDIESEEFKKEALKFSGEAKPKFGIHDIVLLDGVNKSHSPGLVVGISLRTGGYVYDVIRFRAWDGQMERADAIAEKNITALD